jgi:hypothetical protein
MKILLKFAVLIIIAISFAACEKANNPVAPTSFSKTESQILSGTHSGTFEIISPNTATMAGSSTITGTITFDFDDLTSTYKYNGTIGNTDANETARNIYDTGKYEKKGDTVKLVDDPRAETTVGLDYLYLDGIYNFAQDANKISIQGDSELGRILITLYQE